MRRLEDEISGDRQGPEEGHQTFIPVAGPEARCAQRQESDRQRSPTNGTIPHSGNLNPSSCALMGPSNLSRPTAGRPWISKTRGRAASADGPPSVRGAGGATDRRSAGSGKAGPRPPPTRVEGFERRGRPRCGPPPAESGRRGGAGDRDRRSGGLGVLDRRIGEVDPGAAGRGPGQFGREQADVIDDEEPPALFSPRPPGPRERRGGAAGRGWKRGDKQLDAAYDHSNGRVAREHAECMREKSRAYSSSTSRKQMNSP